VDLVAEWCRKGYGCAMEMETLLWTGGLGVLGGPEASRFAYNQNGQKPKHKKPRDHVLNS